jgi:hypothetical protein
VLLNAAGAWGDDEGKFRDTLDLLALLTRAWDLLATVLGWRFWHDEGSGQVGELLDEEGTEETGGLCPGPDWGGMLVASPLLFQTMHQAYLDGLQCVKKGGKGEAHTVIAGAVAGMLKPIRQCLYQLGSLTGTVFLPKHSPASFAARLLSLVEGLLLDGESENLPNSAQEEELVDAARILHRLLTAPGFELATLLQVQDAGQWLGELVRLTKFLLCTRTGDFVPSNIDADPEGLSQATLHLLQVH